MNSGSFENGLDQSRDMDGSSADSDKVAVKKEKKGRRKIKIEFIEDKSRRNITFSKRRFGIMKKARELATLTGTQVLLLVASETGHVYTFATPKLQPLITKPEGKDLIQTCLNGQELSNAPSQTLNSSHNYNAPPLNRCNNNNVQLSYSEYPDERGARYIDPSYLAVLNQKQPKNKVPHNSFGSTIQVLNPKLSVQPNPYHPMRPNFNNTYRLPCPIGQNPAGISVFPHINAPQNGYASHFHLLPSQRVSVEELKRHSEAKIL